MEGLTFPLFLGMVSCSVLLYSFDADVFLKSLLDRLEKLKPHK